MLNSASVALKVIVFTGRQHVSLPIGVHIFQFIKKAKKTCRINFVRLGNVYVFPAQNKTTSPGCKVHMLAL